MIQAGTTTILCVCPLLIIDSYMVLVFTKTIFLVISLGLLHGIIFLPALLITVFSQLFSLDNQTSFRWVEQVPTAWMTCPCQG